jgi:hypothetical protein
VVEVDDAGQVPGSNTVLNIVIVANTPVSDTVTGGCVIVLGGLVTVLVTVTNCVQPGPGIVTVSVTSMVVSMVASFEGVEVSQPVTVVPVRVSVQVVVDTLPVTVMVIVAGGVELEVLEDAPQSSSVSPCNIYVLVAVSRELPE